MNNRKSINRSGFSFFGVVFIVNLFLLLFSFRLNYIWAEETEQVIIEYFGYNTCAACSPEDEFYDLVRKEIGDLREEIPYKIFEYNTFHQEDKEKLAERRSRLQIPDNNGVWPVVILGDFYMIGLNETEQKLRENLILLHNSGVQDDLDEEERENEETVISDSILKPENVEETDLEEAASEFQDFFGSVEEKDSVILYFSTLSCGDCLRVKNVLDSLEPEMVLESGSSSRIRILEINIADEKNVPLLWQLFETYEVPKEEQLVPVLFFEKGFLAGAENTEKYLLEEIKKGSMTDFSADIFSSEEKSRITLSGKMTMFLTGFVSGLNPCGASMLLMLLATAIMLGNGVWKIGITYLIGKFITYFAMGFGLYQIFLKLDHGLLSNVSKTITMISGILFLVLAIMYLIDFWNVRNKKYGKIRMQLPAALRKWNHKKIEQFSSISGRKLYPAIFLLGMIISAGEFFCTGQVYLAAIMYLMKENSGNVNTIVSFLIYISAMCIPSLILVGILEKTENVIRTSDLTLRLMPVIKLVTAIVFLIAGFLMIF